MIKLNKLEVAAMWFFHKDYAAQRIGAVEYFKRLSSHDKRTITDMVKEITDADEPLASGGREVTKQRKVHYWYQLDYRDSKCTPCGLGGVGQITAGDLRRVTCQACRAIMRQKRKDAHK
jgi:hypothetical protein